MFAKLFVLFVAVPVIELFILVQLGTWAGVWITLALVLATGLLGAALAKRQGGLVLRAIRHDLAGGRVPAEHLLDGLLILIGGVLLLTPGLLTDLTGALLMLPPTRTRMKAAIRRWLEARIRSGQVSYLVMMR